VVVQSLSSGERTVAVEAGSGTNASGVRRRMVVVQNWFEELERLTPTN
jgi:hypothetical protein